MRSATLEDTAIGHAPRLAHVFKLWSLFELGIGSAYCWWAISLGCAGILAWGARHSMNPDGLSYLDLAANAVSRGPSELVNGYWSPGYPALIGMALFLFRPSAIQEFPLIHLVNFIVFVFALWSFSVFFRYWLAVQNLGGTKGTSWYITPFAFCTFLLFTLRFIGTEVVTPDLVIAAIVFLTAGLVFRLSLPGSGRKHYVALGLALGTGYYFKAVMFPLGVGLLAFLFLFPASHDLARRKLLWSISAFLLMATPLAVALSVRANRVTFGETGRLNYMWYAGGAHWTDGLENPEPNWTREHPAPKLLTRPLTLQFASPIEATYPLWYDPSHWYAGSTVRFDLRRQIDALKGNARVFKDIILETRAFIFGALVLVFCMIYEKPGIEAPPQRFWFQLAWPLFACSMYALVHVEERFLGAFLALFWLAIYGALICRISGRITLAVCATAVITTVVPLGAQVARESALVPGELIRAKSPEYRIAALGLGELGLRKGDRLAVVGYAYNCYYARYARLRVVAQIPDAQEFWRLNKPEMKVVTDRLASVGVKAIVSWNRPVSSGSADWKDMKVSDSLRLGVLLLSPEDARIR